MEMADAALKRKTARAKWGTVRVDDAADVTNVPKTQARHNMHRRGLGGGGARAGLYIAVAYLREQLAVECRRRFLTRRVVRSG